MSIRCELWLQWCFGSTLHARNYSNERLWKSIKGSEHNLLIQRTQRSRDSLYLEQRMNKRNRRNKNDELLRAIQDEKKKWKLKKCEALKGNEREKKEWKEKYSNNLRLKGIIERSQLNREKKEYASIRRRRGGRS